MPRACAVYVLMDVINNSSYLSESLTAYQKREDYALISELCHGVCRHYFALKVILKALADKSFKSKDLDIEISILLGLYQLKYLAIQPHAAVNETVKLAQTFKKSWARGVINALLRRYLREQSSLESKFNGDIEYTYNHPSWLIKKLQEAGYDLDTICQANDLRPPIYLRINQTKIMPALYLQALAEKGIEAHMCKYLDGAIVLKTKVHVPDLPYFDQGYFFVQDLAAQFATQLLSLKNGLSVLDACSAPGGKLTAILESNHQLGKVVGLDNSERRVSKIHQNLARLQLSAQVLTLDACEAIDYFKDEQFDRILLDAPCSAVGVIRRHPDIKVLRLAHEISEAVAKQAHLLDSLWPLLKVGGRLVYATCSVLPEENEQQLQAFTKRQPDAKVVAIRLPIGYARSIGWQLTPGDSDGFYYGVLERINSAS